MLDVSVNELIAGANDDEYRRTKKEARLFRTISNTYFWGLSGAYVVAFAICLLCDLLINHKLSFSPLVFGGLLVAFTFIPSCIRFTERHKLLLFVASTYLSQVLLFLICCIRFSQNWFGIASTGVLLGYVVVFLPLLLKRYLPTKKKN